MPLPSFIHHGIKKERYSEMADPVAKTLGSSVWH